MRSLLPTLAVSLLTCTIPAQLVISEIDPRAGWLELQNLGKAEIDLSTWSIYHATKTANKPQDYWFGFRKNTKAPAGAILQVFWGQPIPTNPAPGTIYTGNTNWNFLFGHGFETLNPQQGALAVCNTQDNKKMATTGIFVDWVQWGDYGFPREALAVNATPSLWPKDKYITVPPQGASIMLLVDRDTNPADLGTYRFDFSPTPLGVNAFPIGSGSSGQGCYVDSPYTQAIVLGANDISFHGNADFKIVIKNTLGPARFELYWIFLNLSGSEIQWWRDCKILDGALGGAIMPYTPTTYSTTTLGAPLLLPELKGVTAYLQAMTFTPSGAHSFSNRFKLQVSY